MGVRDRSYLCSQIPRKDPYFSKSSRLTAKGEVKRWANTPQNVDRFSCIHLECNKNAPKELVKVVYHR